MFTFADCLDTGSLSAADLAQSIDALETYAYSEQEWEKERQIGSVSLNLSMSRSLNF